MAGNNWHPAVAAQSQRGRKLRTDQAARELGCDESTIRRLCRDRLLAGIKVGRRKWIIPESAIVDYLEWLNNQE